MRLGIGICLLFLLGFSGFLPVSLPSAALFASALAGYFLPESKWTRPGIYVAMGLGTLALLVMVIVGVHDYFDHDC